MEKIRELRVVRKIENGGSFDESLGKAIDHVDDVAREFGPDTRADVLDTATNRIVARVHPGDKGKGKSVGYNAGFSAAWDRMMQRRASREAQGQPSTDD